MGDTSSTSQILTFNAVSRSYAKRSALSSLSLSMEKGETVALLGPNGAGKSTTLGLLLGLIRPHSGSISVLGTTPHHAMASGRVGALLQSTGGGLPPGVRIVELLQLVRRFYRRPAALDLIVQRAGIASLMHRRSHQLSGGQRQRVRFAMAIAGDPEFIVLDEPTSALDITARRDFWTCVRTFAAEGRSILLATHQLTEAEQVADRILVLAAGQLVADGTPQSIKAGLTTRLLRFNSPSVNSALLSSLPAVTQIEIRGEGVTLHSADADLTTRALCACGLAFSDLEITGYNLEEAFFALTSSHLDTDLSS